MRIDQFIQRLEPRQLFSTYYVSTTGNNGNVGDVSHPWATLQHAADTVVAGDTVHVAAGSYTGFAKKLQGTSTSPITFMADGAVDINTPASGPTRLLGIDIEGTSSTDLAHDVIIYGFNLHGIGGTSDTNSAGIQVKFAQNVSILRCSSHDNGWVGIHISHSDYVTVLRCDIYSNNNYVDSGTSRNHGVYIANSSSHVNITRNLIHGNNGNGIHCNGDGGVIGYCVLDGNYIYGNGTTISGKEINGDGLQNSIIRNNVMVATVSNAMKLYRVDANGDSINNKIVNNTFVLPSGQTGTLLYIKDASTGNSIENNLFIDLNSAGTNRSMVDISSASIGTTSTAHTIFDYNAYENAASKPFAQDSSNTTWTDWLNTSNNGGSTFDAHSTLYTTFSSLGVDSSSYVPLSTSPLINAGTATDAPSEDIWRVYRPIYGGIDIGAHEFVLDGDTNYDEEVTADDYGAVDSNLGSGNYDATYDEGDTNHDGFITPDDYSAIDSNLGNSWP